MSSKKTNELFTRLSKFSPFLSRDFLLHNKIKGIEEADYPQAPPFMFYRCFVGYYHDLVARNAKSKAIAPVSSRLGGKDFRGHCVGDAHPENFGVIFDNVKGGVTKFIMNDADDGGPSSMYVDVLRFFAAVKLNNNEDDLGPVISAYLQGVNGKKRKNCKTVRDMVKNAIKKEAKQTGKDYEKKYAKNVVSKSKADHGYNKHKVALTSWEENEVKRILKGTFGKKITMEKAFTYVKVVGGSGGLRRIRILVKYESKKIPRRPNKASKGMLELKELTTPGLFLGAYMSLNQVKKCIKKNLEFEQEMNLGTFYSLVSFNNKPYELRPRFNKYEGVDLESLTKNKERAEVLANEAYILGGLHRRGADHAKRYAKALNKVSKGDWKKAAEFVRRQVTADYKSMAKLSLVKPMKCPS